MKIVELTRDHVEPLSRFFAELPERDRSFIEDDVSDTQVIAGLPERRGKRWVAVDETNAADIAGYVAVRPLTGWSNHVGNLQLIVHPNHRHSGVGTELARHALASALNDGLHKVQVEIAADHESAIEMFAELGFTGEALLRDHIRDRNGEYRDLVVLAHLVEDAWAAMDTVGLAEELAT